MQRLSAVLRRDPAWLASIAATSWAIARLTLRLGPGISTLLTVAAACVAALVIDAVHRKQPSLTWNAAGLSLTTRSASAFIQWDAIDLLIRSEVALHAKPAPIEFYTLHSSAGTSVHFGSLSRDALSRVELSDGTTILDVPDAPALARRIRDRLVPAAARNHSLDAPSVRPALDRRVRLEDLPRWALGILAFVRLLASLSSVPQAAVAAAASGILAVVALALIASALQRRATRRRLGVDPALITPGVLLAVGAVAANVPLGGARTAGAWALSAALFCALPVRPLPAAVWLRRIARRDPGVANALSMALAIVATVLLSRGMTVLPVAFFAAAIDAQWHHGPADTCERDHPAGSPPATNWLALAYVVPVIIASAMVRAQAHGPDEATAAAVRWLLS